MLYIQGDATQGNEQRNRYWNKFCKKQCEIKIVTSSLQGPQIVFIIIYYIHIANYGFYMGVWTEPSRISPFMGFHFHLVPLVASSAIAKTIFVKIPIFRRFRTVWTLLKHRLKQKRCIFLKNLHLTLSHSLQYGKLFV